VEALKDINPDDDAWRSAFFMWEPTKATAATADKESKPADPPEDLDLLPWPGFDGYSLDRWARPHGTGGKGRKKGPLTLDKKWHGKKGEKLEFKFGYRPYLNGSQVFRSQRTVTLARHNAERARTTGQKPWSE